MVTLPSFTSARVLVCGDVMLDRYWSGPVHRISPEAPVPILCVGEEDQRPGGAANVALGVAALGAHCALYGLVGDDPEATALEQALAAGGVVCQLHRVPDWRTVTKLRVISRAQQLLRLDFETHAPARGTLEKAVTAALPDANLLLCSDYGKGALRAPETLVADSRRLGVTMVVDTKASSFTRWHGATLLKTNLAEFVVATNGQVPADLNELHVRGRALREAVGVAALLITRGEQGMTLLTADSVLDLPARAHDVFDVTGAGDTVAAVVATALAAGVSLADAVRLANVAAGRAVAHLGAVAVSSGELRAALGESSGLLLERATLLEVVAAARDRGERIVFTNGCFDLLHAGHVAYLEEARSLGDRLLVAVNDDASVRRLKGPGRPYNVAADRARLLTGLRSVDWVTVFSEDTPEPLLEALVPDVLVKGGDYSLEQVAGAELVRAAGGHVAVLGLRPGLSTTALAQRLRES